MEEDVEIYDIHLTREEVLLARKIISARLKERFDHEVFGLYDNFLIAIGNE